MRAEFTICRIMGVMENHRSAARGCESGVVPAGLLDCLYEGAGSRQKRTNRRTPCGYHRPFRSFCRICRCYELPLSSLKLLVHESSLVPTPTPGKLCARCA